MRICVSDVAHHGSFNSSRILNSVTARTWQLFSSFIKVNNNRLGDRTDSWASSWSACQHETTETSSAALTQLPWSRHRNELQHKRVNINETLSVSNQSVFELGKTRLHFHALTISDQRLRIIFFSL